MAKTSKSLTQNSVVRFHKVHVGSRGSFLNVNERGKCRAIRPLGGPVELMDLKRHEKSYVLSC